MMPSESVQNSLQYAHTENRIWSQCKVIKIKFATAPETNSQLFDV